MHHSLSYSTTLQYILNIDLVKNIGGMCFIRQSVLDEYMDFNIRKWSELHDADTRKVAEAAEEEARVKKEEEKASAKEEKEQETVA